MLSPCDRTALALFKTVPAPRTIFYSWRKAVPTSPIAGAITSAPFIITNRCRTSASITTEQITRRRELSRHRFQVGRSVSAPQRIWQHISDELATLEFDFDNGFFSGFDAAVYYSLIRHLQAATDHRDRRRLFNADRRTKR